MKHIINKTNRYCRLWPIGTHTILRRIRLCMNTMTMTGNFYDVVHVFLRKIICPIVHFIDMLAEKYTLKLLQCGEVQN